MIPNDLQGNHKPDNVTNGSNHQENQKLIQKAGTPFQQILLLGLALALGFLFDLFLFGEDLGISFFLYTVIVLGTFGGIAAFFKIKRAKSSYLLSALTLFFAAMVFIRASGPLTFMNVSLTLALLGIIVVSLTGFSLEKYHIRDYFRFLLFPFDLIGKSFSFLEKFELKKVFKDHQKVSQVAKGFLLSLPFLLIFLMLFASADLVFSQYLKEFFHFKFLPPFRILTFAIISTLALGNLVFIAEGNENKPLWAANNEEKRTLGNIQTAVFLGMINLLFLAFILIQITYLFGGEKNIVEAGFTYAEYARRGFFELIAVAAITSIILVFCDKKTELRLTSNEPAIDTAETATINQLKKGAEGESAVPPMVLSHSPAFKITAVLLALQVIILMISAFTRLSLYEYAFGFTELRLYSHIFILWLAAIFIVMLVKFIKNHRETTFTTTIFIITIFFAIGVNIFNPDAFIVRQNIALSINPLQQNNMMSARAPEFEGRENLVEITPTPPIKELDTYYLSLLSEDALPEIVKAFNENPDLHSSFTEPLMSFYRKSTSYSPSWQSWHYSRSMAKELLGTKSVKEFLKGIQERIQEL